MPPAWLTCQPLPQLNKVPFFSLQCFEGCFGLTRYNTRTDQVHVLFYPFALFTVEQSCVLLCIRLLFGTLFMLQKAILVGQETIGSAQAVQGIPAWAGSHGMFACYKLEE